MRMMLKLIIVSLLLSTYAIAEEKGKPDCKEIIKAADKALDEKNKQIKLEEEALKKSQEESKSLQEEVKAKEGQIKNPLRKPIVLLGVGVIGTVAGGPILAGLGALLLGVILD